MYGTASLLGIYRVVLDAYLYLLDLVTIAVNIVFPFLQACRQASSCHNAAGTLACGAFTAVHSTDPGAATMAPSIDSGIPNPLTAN